MPEHSPGAPTTDDASRLSPSGRQLRISLGDASCVVTEVGAGLRSFEVAGDPIVYGYDEAEICSGGRGQVLAPWPNRLEDGTYEFNGRTGCASIDEPEHGNAIHGLVRWLAWVVTDESDARVSLETVIVPQPAYPWRVRVGLSYELVSPSELEVTVTATNEDSAAAPFGIGFHPYVHAGAAGVDACTLVCPATRHLLANDRALPVGEEETAGSDFDFADPRTLDGVRLDDCFTGLGPAPWSVEVGRPDGLSVRVSGSSELGYVMCYTADTLGPADRRRGIAIEPMSCPPNALRTGTDLVTLAPSGALASSFGATWGISVSATR